MEGKGAWQHIVVYSGALLSQLRGNLLLVLYIKEKKNTSDGPLVESQHLAA